jgi:hypothetical protein
MQMEHVADLLLTCVHQDPDRLDPSRLAQLRSAEWDLLMDLAAKQRVKALLYHSLHQRGITAALPAEVVDALRNRYLRTATRGLLLQGELRRMSAVLEAERVPVIALKGVVLASSVYKNIALREMNDIDIMVPREQMQRAWDALATIGYLPLTASSVEIAMTRHHHAAPLVKINRALVELHWTLTQPGERWSIDPAELWERSEPVDGAGAHLRTLAPEDLLLYLCQHTSYHHHFTFGLRPSCDIAQSIAHYGLALNWEVLIERAVQWQWERGVLLALRIAHDLVGARVPEEVLRRLALVDQNVIIAARGQIFTDASISSSIPSDIAPLWTDQDAAAKARVVFRRIFPTRRELSQKHGVPLTSPWLYTRYLVRRPLLLRRLRWLLWILMHRKPELTSFVGRKKLLDDWLSEHQTV